MYLIIYGTLQGEFRYLSIYLSRPFKSDKCVELQHMTVFRYSYEQYEELNSVITVDSRGHVLRTFVNGEFLGEIIVY